MRRSFTQLSQSLRRRFPRLDATVAPVADRIQFNDVLATWKPLGRAPAIMLRWLVTEWCNYSCSYCKQTHRRDQDKGDGKTAHAFDNHPVESWIKALRGHFAGRRLSVTLSGGEPLLDRKAMPVLINALSSLPTVEHIRVDTNGSWDPKVYADMDKSKLLLNCSFHPQRIGFEEFFAKLRAILDHGFRVGMVNYVMTEAQFDEYMRLKPSFASLGVPLNPNPDFNRVRDYPAEKRDLLLASLPMLDYRFKVLKERPRGRRCLYPTLTYELDYRGTINAGCFPDRSGSLFDDRLPPLPRSAPPCPRAQCGCLDMYSFLEGERRNATTDPLDAYSKELAARSAG